MMLFGYLFAMFIFPVLAFKTIMGVFSLFSLRKKIFHEIIMKQLLATASATATGEVNQTSSQFNKSLSSLDFSKLSKEQVRILEQFVPKSKSLALSKAVKKTIKTSIKFALVAFGIMLVFFLTLYLINFFMIAYL